MLTFITISKVSLFFYFFFLLRVSYTKAIPLKDFSFGIWSFKYMLLFHFAKGGSSPARNAGVA